MVTIAVGVVSFNRGPILERCLDSVREHTTLPYRMYVVDNGSEDAVTQALLDKTNQDMDSSVLRLDRNYGVSYARNRILELAGGRHDLYAMLDDDVAALPHWDTAALRAVEAGADLVQPLLLRKDGRIVDRGPNRKPTEELAANPEFIGRGLDKADPCVNRQDEADIVGTAAVIRKEVFDRIGGYDVGLDIGEDYDLSFRARAAGFSLRYVPDCLLIHDHGFNLAYDQERGRVEKYLKSHVVMWGKHNRVLLSPAYFEWFRWLHRNGEPMYMPAGRKWHFLARRLRRRVVRRWCMSRYRERWASPEIAGRAAEDLAAELRL